MSPSTRSGHLLPKFGRPCHSLAEPSRCLLLDNVIGPGLFLLSVFLLHYVCVLERSMYNTWPSCVAYILTRNRLETTQTFRTHLLTLASWYIGIGNFGVRLCVGRVWRWV
jgi:hypothetical protein